LGQSNNAQTVLKVNNLIEDNNLQADVQLLRSKFFISKAVERLPLGVRYFFRGQILTEEHYKQSFYQINNLQVINVAVRGRPITVSRVDDGAILVSYTIGATAFSFPVEPGRPFSTPHFSGKLDFVGRSKWPAGQDRGTYYFTLNETRSLTGELAPQISVSIADPNAKTIVIAYKDHNAMLARDLCQAMADAYIQYDLERKSESAESILRFIENQKDTVFAELRDSELQLGMFKRDNRVANMDQLTPLLLKRSDEYEDAMLKLRMEDNVLKEIEAAANQEEGHLNVYELTPLMAGANLAPALQEAIKAMGKLLQDRETMAFEVTTENENLRVLDRQIELQQGLIMESIGTLRDRIASRMADFTGKLNEYEDRFSQLPEKELAYARIERLFNINEKYYTQLLEKDIEYRISKAGFVSENHVLETAVLPTQPITPNRSMVLLSYILTGLIIGVLIVMVRYILHNNITSLNDIAKARKRCQRSFIQYRSASLDSGDAASST
ncbi:MAG: GNVR domain-containing protein, partial [Flavobacteriales bacterium]